MFSRQVRSATGSLRGHISRAGSSSTRGPARYASSSSPSSSSNSSSGRSLYPAAPIALIALVVGASIYTHSNQLPHSHEKATHVKRKEYWERMRQEERKQKEEEEAKSESDSSKESPTEGNEEVVSVATNDLAEEASQESAFDPETNTINWDCPCLGGMAHGPCGEEFKTAFSCFVFSEAEPKGIDCVENFKAMQDCFRKHPEHYKDEIEDDEEFENQERAAGGDVNTPQSKESSEGKEDEDEDEGVREFRREMSKES